MNLEDMELPHSDSTVQVSLIDTELVLQGMPGAAFYTPDIPGNELITNGTALTFLIQHKGSMQSHLNTLLFDLGARKDFQNSPTTIIQDLESINVKVISTKSVYEILQANSFDPARIGGIIWSHAHMDHMGDPSQFPTSTSLIVGPGFKKTQIPAWPTNPESRVHESAWHNRELLELDFDDKSKTLKLGQYQGYDFYGDGSFYLFHSPGHTSHHLCGLARTSTNPPEFVLMGGDIAHHGSEFRPTEMVPLPKEIVPNPLVAPFTRASFICPGAIFEAIHPLKSSIKPFTEAKGFIHENPVQACESVEKLLEFDAQDNVFVMIAHDASLVNVVDHFPKTLNQWKAKGWKEQSHWRFLRDFDTGNEKYRPQ